MPGPFAGFFPGPVGFEGPEKLAGRVGSGQEVFGNRSGRVGPGVWKLTGRVGSSQQVFNHLGSGRVVVTRSDPRAVIRPVIIPAFMQQLEEGKKRLPGGSCVTVCLVGCGLYAFENRGGGRGEAVHGRMRWISDGGGRV